MKNHSKIIPILIFGLLLLNKAKAQIIFYQHFNDTSFFKTWKVSENIEHAKPQDVNQTRFLKFHPVLLNEYVETPIIPVSTTNNYSLLFDWHEMQNDHLDSIEVDLSKDDGFTWQNIKTLKNGHHEFWLRDSVYLGLLNAKENVMFRWQYHAAIASPIQTFNLDNVIVRSTNAVNDTQQIISTLNVKISFDTLKTKVKIECKNSEGKSLQLRMYTTRGYLLKNISLPISKKNNVEIDVGDVSKGTYFISIESKDEFFTQQIIL